MNLARILPALALFAAAALAALPGCSSATGILWGKDDYKIRFGKFMRGDTSHQIRAFHVPGLGATAGDADAVSPPLARIAYAGGTAVAFDLAGLTAEGVDPAAVAAVTAIAGRAKDQRMATIVRIAPEGDPDARLRAVTAAAEAIQGERRALYWIDAPDAGALTAAFKKAAPGLLTAAAEGGDLRVLAGDAAEPEALDIVLWTLPESGPEAGHFVLADSLDQYEALDTALLNPAARQEWTPDNSVLSAEEREEGFVALFNGRDFDGWWFWGDNPAAFIVNDQAEIELVQTGAAAIMTRDRYDNFILRVEFLTEGGNSGIFLRAPRASRQSYIGMEFQIYLGPDAEVNDDMTGAIYQQAAPLVNAIRPAGEWNELEIICDGPHLKATLNGQLIQDINLDEHPELKHRLRDGFIGLQDHRDFVKFRNVRVKRL